MLESGGCASCIAGIIFHSRPLPTLFTYCEVSCCIVLLYRHVESFCPGHLFLDNSHQMVQVPVPIPSRLDGYVSLVPIIPLLIRGCRLHFLNTNVLDTNIPVEIMLGIGARDGADEHHLQRI